MKKLLLASIISGLASVAAADSFQDMNNNLYAQYQYVGFNGSTGLEASQYGIGGTFQSKNNVWLNANAVSGTNNDTTSSSLGFAAGYAFQFFGDEQQGFQVIPHVNFSTQNGVQLGAVSTSGTQYVYGLGVKPEYRLLNSLKVAVDMTLLGTQTSNAAGDSTQIFAFAVTPGIQYDINKTVMLGLDYSYAANFNNNTETAPNGVSTVTAKVGYLF